MLYSLGHGQHTFLEKSSDEALSQADTPASCTMELPTQGIDDPGGKFAFFFPDTPEIQHTTDMAQRLDHLADAMLEPADDDDAANSAIPPIYTYFGQFIDHDATANTDRESGASNIQDDALTPVSRQQVESDLLNLRNGSMRLDSLYGDGPGGGPFSDKLMRLMRFPGDPAKMRLGIPAPIPVQSTPLPDDPASDLLRIHKLIAEHPDEGITLQELRALPEGLRRSFLDENDELVPQRAVIGDARNDENLVVAQLQVAFLRFHNVTVDWLRSNGRAPAESQALFEEARKQVIWHYQWLIVNDFLKRLARSDMLEFVMSTGASLYTGFFDRHRPSDTDRMPMPLEFSVAAYRFGHTMVRAEYDFNRFFGAAAPEAPNNAPFAILENLFRFTGRGPTPMTTPNGDQFDRLPSNWVIEWKRFVTAGAGRRFARKIDTLLVPLLKNLPNEMAGVFKHLGRRNLRRGHKLNLPSAQACISEYNRVTGAQISCLSNEELLSGKTRDAVQAGNFLQETPLWFYVLKEAEVREQGERLGMLGSALVAETLVGLIANDPHSYWNAPGQDDAPWHPADGIRGPDNEIIDSLPALLRAARML